jgi:hypothetical protein
MTDLIIRCRQKALVLGFPAPEIVRPENLDPPTRSPWPPPDSGMPLVGMAVEVRRQVVPTMTGNNCSPSHYPT